VPTRDLDRPAIATAAVLRPHVRVDRAVRARVAKVNPRRRHHADAFEGRDVDRVKFDGAR
jgi:hypothetical protein